MNVAYIPNCITALRIAGTLGMIFTEPFTLWFYVVYTITGITDILDGFIARRLKVTSEFGARLDSVADVFFYIVMIVKILPKLVKKLPVQIWCAVGVIFILRVTSYVFAALKFHKFASVHTIMNKLTVFTVFLVPFFMDTHYLVTICTVICTMGIIALLEELLIHILRKDASADVKTIFALRPGAEK